METTAVIFFYEREKHTLHHRFVTNYSRVAAVRIQCERREAVQDLSRRGSLLGNYQECAGRPTGPRQDSRRIGELLNCWIQFRQVQCYAFIRRGRRREPRRSGRLRPSQSEVPDDKF